MEYIIVSGSSNQRLAHQIAKSLNCEVAETELTFFTGNEQRIRIITPVKGKQVFLVQSTNANPDYYLIQTILLANAANAAGAAKISLIIPWFGYSPQDKIFRPGEPLSSEAIIKCLESSPIDDFLIYDIHSPEILKMFSKPVKHLSATNCFAHYFDKNLRNDQEWVVAALDKGAKNTATEFAKILKLDLVKLEKVRDLVTGKVEFRKLNGNVKNKNVISIDDFSGTGSTKIKSCEYLKAAGALSYYCFITHIFEPAIYHKLKDSGIDLIISTNTTSAHQDLNHEKIIIIDLAAEIAAHLFK